MSNELVLHLVNYPTPQLMYGLQAQSEVIQTSVTTHRLAASVNTSTFPLPLLPHLIAPLLVTPSNGKKILIQT